MIDPAEVTVVLVFVVTGDMVPGSLLKCEGKGPGRGWSEQNFRIHIKSAECSGVLHCAVHRFFQFRMTRVRAASQIAEILISYTRNKGELSPVQREIQP